MLRVLLGFAAIAALVSLAGCGDNATLPIKAQTGSNLRLPPPDPERIPTVNIAPAEAWTADATPTVAPGFEVNAFARGLDHPRWLYVLPNGDVLVAESNGPAEAQGLGGLKGWVMKRVMKRAGAGVPSPDRIVLLRDSNGDGVADVRSVFLDHLHSPFGMTLLGGSLYVADTDALLRFPYREGETSIAARAEKVADLPAGPINYHWTKNVVAGSTDDVLYVAIGSNSNVGERGMAVEQDRARIIQVDPATGDKRTFAFGTRNPVGMAVQPGTGALWAVVNERDELGGDLVPDYLTRVTQDGFYGWPYSYFGQHVDPRVKPQRPDLVARAIVPDYALGSHVAALGLAFYTGDLFPARYRGGAFIGEHGSWNRRPRSGYKVVFIPFADDQPAGPPEDILTGFVAVDGKARGRPVGVAVDHAGALLVADDVGNAIWRVTPTGKTSEGH
ncbi:MAG TPA: sorbosone dehydrogenase family protein [Rhodanobacteraceae bacterium]